jgi:hypothetical protein
MAPRNARRSPKAAPAFARETAAPRTGCRLR